MREFVSNHIAVILTTSAVVIGGAYFYQVTAEQDRAACQAEYNTAFAVQITERARLSAASDDAKTDLLSGISKIVFAPPTTDPKAQVKRAEQFRALFSKFDKATAKVEKDRAATPLPTIPNC